MLANKLLEARPNSDKHRELLAAFSKTIGQEITDAWQAVLDEWHEDTLNNESPFVEPVISELVNQLIGCY